MMSELVCFESCLGVDWVILLVNCLEGEGLAPCPPFRLLLTTVAKSPLLKRRTGDLAALDEEVKSLAVLGVEGAPWRPLLLIAAPMWAVLGFFCGGEFCAGGVGE